MDATKRFTLIALFAVGGSLSALWVTALATLVLAALCALETLETL